MLDWMKWAADYALWDLLSTLILFLSAVIGFTVLFWTKRRVRNLNFFTQRRRDETNYPLKVYIEIRNYTGRSVVISYPFYRYKDLRADPNARGDSPSGDYELKFPDVSQRELREVEYLIRHGENVSTWIPVDPNHTDGEIDEAIRRRRVATLYCRCTWLEEKPRFHKLRRNI